MATGDITVYSKLIKAETDQSTLASMPVDYNGDTLKLIILDTGHTPDTSDSSAQEHLDDISSDEVTTTAGYTGAITLTTVTVTQTSDIVSVGAADIAITADGSGFTIGRYAVVYKDSGTPATSPLICLVDFGATISIAVNDLQINWGGGVVFTKSKS